MAASAVRYLPVVGHELWVTSLPEGDVLWHTVAFSSVTGTAVVLSRDEVAEWLRRWTANPMGSPRVSSNLILVDCFDLMSRI